MIMLYVKHSDHVQITKHCEYLNSDEICKLLFSICTDYSCIYL